MEYRLLHLQVIGGAPGFSNGEQAGEYIVCNISDYLLCSFHFS